MFKIFCYIEEIAIGRFMKALLESLAFLFIVIFIPLLFCSISALSAMKKISIYRESFLTFIAIVLLVIVIFVIK